MKTIDTSKLQKVDKKPNGEIIAQCPACAAASGDTKGEHLIVYPSKAFACVANLKDKAHNQEIFKLVGIEDGKRPEKRRVRVRPHIVLPPTVVMVVPRKTLEELGLIRDPARRLIMRP
jgi:hypothetical protein